jgi:hypothetical protein
MHLQLSAGRTVAFRATILTPTPQSPRRDNGITTTPNRNSASAILAMAGTETSGGAPANSMGRRALLVGTGGVAAASGCEQLLRPAPAAGAESGSYGSGPRGGAADLGAQLDSRVSEFQLPNGLRFIVAERHAAPTVACRTYADVGAFDEADGSTGIAHLLGALPPTLTSSPLPFVRGEKSEVAGE